MEAGVMAEPTPTPSGNSALGLAALGGGLDLLSGLFGFMTGQEIAGIHESRARMISDEAESDAQRHAEAGESFKARQKLSFLKAGVALTGSPLDILDETARVTAENISAIRARGAAQALDARGQALAARGRGRTAFIQGISRGIRGVSRGFLMREEIRRSSQPRKRTPLGGDLG